jgi:hypothetical protein
MRRSRILMTNAIGTAVPRLIGPLIDIIANYAPMEGHEIFLRIFAEQSNGMITVDVPCPRSSSISITAIPCDLWVNGRVVGHLSMLRTDGKFAIGMIGSTLFYYGLSIQELWNVILRGEVTLTIERLGWAVIRPSFEEQVMKMVAEW